MTNNAAGAGMGTSGLVGQIMTFTDMGFSLDIFFKVMVLHIILPAALSYLIYLPMYRKGLIKDGDLKLEL